MKKYEFLYRLQHSLASLPEADRTGHCGFYEELIDDMAEDGIPEEEAVARLGDPEELAGSILRQEGVTTEKASSGGWRETLSRLLQTTVNAVRESAGPRESYEQRVDGYAIRAVEICWNAGDVTIRGESRGDVLLSESRVPEDPALVVEVLDGVLHIDAAPEGQRCRREKTLSLALPGELAETLERCAVTTASGDVTIRGLRAGMLSAGSRSGDLQITDSAAGTASFSSASATVLACNGAVLRAYAECLAGRFGSESAQCDGAAVDQIRRGCNLQVSYGSCPGVECIAECHDGHLLCVGSILRDGTVCTCCVGSHPYSAFGRALIRHYQSCGHCYGALQSFQVAALAVQVHGDELRLTGLDAEVVDVHLVGGTGCQHPEEHNGQECHS